MGHDGPGKSEVQNQGRHQKGRQIIAIWSYQHLLPSHAVVNNIPLLVFSSQGSLMIQSFYGALMLPKSSPIFTTELGAIDGTDIQASITRIRDYIGVDAFNIHDCPNARLRMNSVMAGSIIKRQTGIEVISHYTCRDRSLVGTQADMLGAHALGVRAILPTTGDGPDHGPYPSKPVYDYSSVQLIKIIKGFNHGLDVLGNPFTGPTAFTVAATANPGAPNLSAELDRVQKKIDAGADFFQTQPVYDVDTAFAFFDKTAVMTKPMLLGVMPLKSLKMAEFVKTKVAGVNVPNHVISDLEKGRSGFEIACELIERVRSHVNGLHIFAMGDVELTNRLIAFSKGAGPFLGA